ncbi:nonribosomal peptide synthase [Penicillium taxi]|uniref:nonribosomal peptide synthase n=1 Tax=Penicillium taxi TaxID=168475 RepID=UPI002544F9C2|nr:nonribosomal peptide synthase [Penicillium taxi]KAJ5909124.1 nonribosomal peptide synthase [Penicillium taxi]
MAGIVARQSIAQTKDERQHEPAEDLITIFDRIAQTQPNDTALVSLHQKDSLGISSLRWTYSELRDGSIRLAHRMSAAGVRKGSRIATFLFNEIEWSVLFLASARLGCHFVPLDPRALNTPADAIYLLRKVWAETIVVSNLSMANMVQRILETELMPQIQLKCLVSHSTGDRPRGWRTLSSLMTESNDEIEIAPLPVLDRNDTILMLCTSGTTSNPKICPHTSVSIVTPALGIADHWSLTREQSLCQHLPSFHVFNVALTLSFWVAGATVIIPSAEFNPAATFEGLAFGKHVWIASVPTMVYAMQTYSMTVDKKLAKPYGIVLGGAPITPEALRSCKELGARRIVAGYGTTEGVATLYNVMSATDPSIVNMQDGDDVRLGQAVAGSHLRICAPDSRVPLQRNQIGELHQGGYPIFHGYYEATEEQNYTCYREGSVPWFATGDRGYMDEDGNIYLLGRYKDLIIRSGENISPLKIEQCLSGQPGVKTAVVVGSPDDIAGEVPVAVVETYGPQSDTFFRELKSAVVQALGRSFAPKLILHLQDDLGREKYPSTTSGKIKKNVLQDWVADHLELSRAETPLTPQSLRTPVSSLSSNTSVGTNVSLNPMKSVKSVKPESIPAPNRMNIATELATCWSSVSGLDLYEIKPDMPIRTFTDSTMLIQFLHLAKKKGLKLTLKDLITANTIEKQAQLLGQTGVESQLPDFSAPVSVQVSSQLKLLPKTDTKKRVAAASLGINENDIEKLLPMTDLFQMLALDRPFPGAWDMRLAFSVRRALNADEIAAIVETWLRRHELLRSMVATVKDEPPVWAVMHPRAPWLRNQIIQGPAVDNIDAVEHYHPNDYTDVASGPLCKAVILPIRGTTHCGLIIHIHHVIFDGMVMERWIRDLNHLLDGQPQLQWCPYNYFSDNYIAHRASPEAEESVQYFVRKLTGVSASKNAIWDTQRILQSMDRLASPLVEKESDFTMINAKKTPARTHPSVLPKRFVQLPKLAEMRSRFGISAPIIALAACSLINCRYTGADEAIFTNLQSGRSWPVEDGPGSEDASPLEVDGPTMANLPARIAISPEDSVLDLLNKARSEQDDMLVHSHVPSARIIEGVARGPGGLADAAVLEGLLKSQLFDWLLEPYNQDLESPLELLLDTSLSQGQWVWLPRLSDGNILHMNIYHADADLPPEKTDYIAEEFLCAAAWLADPSNAQKSISECVFDGYEVRYSDYTYNVSQ